ncbi:hypothetical protein [Spirosoma jeollabukense]
METIIAYWDTENNDNRAYASCPHCKGEMCLPAQSLRHVKPYTPVPSFNYSLSCATCKIQFQVSQVLV